MSWFEHSIMARKGVAKGKPGAKHAITEATQGKYHYTYGPFAEPVLDGRSRRGRLLRDPRRLRGRDQARDRQAEREAQLPVPQSAERPDLRQWRREGRLPRGSHQVDRAARAPAGRHDRADLPEFGGLVGTTTTALLNKPLPEYVKKIEVTVEGGVKWSDKITLPYEPFIGTIGTAPEIEAISSLVPDYYGGNMDLPDVAPDTVIYLPVNAPGALLYLGDCHAIQGDGELCGVALEHPTVTTVQVDLIKGWTIAWPRLETTDFYMTIGSARPMEDASRIAYRELIRWMGAEFGFDETDAYLLLTMCGKMRLGNMVDPKYTLGASIAKSIVEAHR